MLFAAGLGTRLKPFTNNHPKALATIHGKTLLERNITYLKSFGIQDIIINIHHFGDQILNFLEKNHDFNCSVSISDERQEVLETGGGLVKAQKLLGEQPFLVMNVDILTDMDLDPFIKYHNQNNPLVTLAVSDRESSRKLYFNKKKELVGWKNFNTQQKIFISAEEEKKAVPLAFSGIHIINPKIFSLITQTGKFSIMDAYLNLMKVHKILGYQHQSYLIDVGKPESIIEAEKHFK